MKENAIANLAASTEDFFLKVKDLMEKNSVKSMWDKEWFPNISGKQAFYKGVSQFYKVRLYFKIRQNN